MNSFAFAVNNQSARTENNMAALKSSGSALMDFFYSAGASRGKNIIPAFVSAYVENSEYALRIVQWLRDVRGGSGERELFRNILRYLERTSPEDALRLLKKIPEIGRWDDCFIFETPDLKFAAFEMVANALKDGNALAAKWTPRIKSAKASIAIEFQKYLGLSPRQYRKMLSSMTNVVETQMCENQWDDINFSHVPSLAATRYKKAFNRHTPKFAEYVEALKSGDPSVSINAGAVYPHDIIKELVDVSLSSKKLTKPELDHIEMQWNALENFIGDHNILPLVDVSGSMTAPIGGKLSGLNCMDVAISIGLYCADKNTGPFNGIFLSFSEYPEIYHLKGNIVQKTGQMLRSHWGMNTDLNEAIDKILQVAIESNVSKDEMPSILLILSDMQFDMCVRFDDSANEMIKRKYAESGYTMPNVVFWNLNNYANVPVKFDERGIAMVSGFSPSILKAVLSADFAEFTPWNIMMKAIMKSRYDLV